MSPTRIRSFVCCLFLVAAAGAYAQRLPDTVIPEHYKLTLTPNLANATFVGDETIDVMVQQPVEAITLNATEITFGTVTAIINGHELEATISLDAAKQQASFTFGRTIPAGEVSINILYHGMLNNELRGFYLSKTEKRNYAVTQFESTDARRAFPSFDEPAFKATFDVTLVVDKNDTAISNTNIVWDVPGPQEDKHSIHFATTPKMSTYLVAFLVGDFECIRGTERRDADPRVRDAGEDSVRGVCAVGGGVRPALLQHVFRNPLPDAEAGSDWRFRTSKRARWKILGPLRIARRICLSTTRRLRSTRKRT